MPVTVEVHHVLAGVVWLNHAPVLSVEHVRCAVDPEAVWITLRPGRDYGIVDAEGGQIYVSALIGTLVEIEYAIKEGPDMAVRPRWQQALMVAENDHQGAHRQPLVTGDGDDYDGRAPCPVPGIGALVSGCNVARPVVNGRRPW